MRIKLELHSSLEDRMLEWSLRRARMLLAADEEFPLIKGLVDGYYEAIRPIGEGVVWEGEANGYVEYKEMMGGFMEACKRYPNSRLVIKGSSAECGSVNIVKLRDNGK